MRRNLSLSRLIFGGSSVWVISPGCFRSGQISALTYWPWGEGRQTFPSFLQSDTMLDVSVEATAEYFGLCGFCAVQLLCVVLESVRICLLTFLRAVFEKNISSADFFKKNIFCFFFPQLLVTIETGFFAWMISFLLFAVCNYKSCCFLSFLKPLFFSISVLVLRFCVRQLCLLAALQKQEPVCLMYSLLWSWVKQQWDDRKWISQKGHK